MEERNRESFQVCKLAERGFVRVALRSDDWEPHPYPGFRSRMHGMSLSMETDRPGGYLFRVYCLRVVLCCSETALPVPRFASRGGLELVTCQQIGS